MINNKFPVDTIILNKDSNHFKILIEKAKKFKINNILTYSKNKNANLMYCNHTTTNSSLCVEVALDKEKKIKYKINSMNDYLISNTMGIIASLSALGLNLDLIKNLKNLELTEGRGNIIKLKKMNKIIELHNHSYNSSPTSLFSGLNVFLKTSNKKNLIIIGDMHELGKNSEHYHLKVLKFLLKNKTNNYLMVGKFFYKYRNRFNSDKIKFLLNVDQLNDIVFNYVRDYNRIFIKGSNSINLQKTVDLISNKLVA
jgi:UDP-N-acetylmuramoyl-tripeptide--D-alanyl-D-alanine ligase